MRISSNAKYNQFQASQSSLQSKINELTTQIASGKKIQNSYENSHIYEKDLQLSQQETTLSQEIDVARNAYNMTLSTDKALAALNKSISEFKTKLIQVANQPQNTSSRLAVASELEGLKNHITSIANTSIGGAYLFSGSKVRTQPIAQDGKYMGNSEKLEALIGSNIKVPFNIPGSDLFFGNNNGSFASTTGNIKKYNLSKLYPELLSKTDKTEPPQKVFIKSSDTIRDLIGDEDDDPSNDSKVFFYLRGIRPDGTRFKSKFALDKSYVNLENSVKVQDLLDRIGREFGNNQATQVVDVRLNPWGEIEIRSLVAGSSNLEFNLLASDMDTEDLSQLPQMGAKIMSFQKSPYLSSTYLPSIKGIIDPYRQNQVVLPTSLISQTTKMPANKNTRLDEIFHSNIVNIHFDGNFTKDEKGEKIPQILSFSTKDTKIYDVLKDIETFYEQNGHKVQAEIADGKIILVDLEAQKANKPTNIQITLSTYDKEGESINGIPSDYKNTYDAVFFDKRGQKLVANSSQILASKDGYATNQTKLSEVAGDLNNQVYKMTLKDHNGQVFDANMVFYPKGIFLELPRQDPNSGQSKMIRIPVVNLNEKGALNLTHPSEITYRQFMDALAIVLNYSNQKDEVYEKLSENPDNYTAEQKEMYEKILIQSQSKIGISLNQNGQIEILDKVRPSSVMEFSFSNASSNDFSEKALRDTQSGLVLHANSSLSISKPQVNFFNILNQAISAVKEGIYRPDEYPNSFNHNMRNIGIQNSLEAMENLEEHVRKLTATNGSYGKTFENSITKNENLRTQVQTLRGENMGADIAETYNKLQSLTANYDAVLNSSGKINKLSVLDYL